MRRKAAPPTMAMGLPVSCGYTDRSYHFFHRVPLGCQVGHPKLLHITVRNVPCDPQAGSSFIIYNQVSDSRLENWKKYNQGLKTL